MRMSLVFGYSGGIGIITRIGFESEFWLFASETIICVFIFNIRMIMMKRGLS